MKLVVLAVVGLCAVLAVQDPQQPAASGKAAAQNPGPDPDLMQVYQFGLFLPGDQREEALTKLSRTEIAELQRQHLANIMAMAQTGKLVLAGPFVDPEPGAPRGLLLFDVPTADEARAMVADDPFVQRGILKLELTGWYGPKGITSAWHEQQKKQKKQAQQKPPQDGKPADEDR